MTTSRRTFLRGSGLALGTLFGGPGAVRLVLAQAGLLPTDAGPSGLDPAIVGVVAAAESSVIPIPPYLADVNGNGMLGPIDELIVRRAMESRRRFEIEPADGYDIRADIFGRGRVAREDLDSVAVNVAMRPVDGLLPQPRPITVAWHYGWYNRPSRSSLTQTVKFVGGDYTSKNPEIEGTFNRLKNEFGITVDALSWITPKKNPRIEANFRQGYMQSPDLGSRYVALLYESTISLPGEPGQRKDFVSTKVRARLVADLKRMGRFLAEIRDDSPARVFTLDGRPVVFLFGSHTWGIAPGMGFEFDAMDVAIEDARNAFAAAYGTVPYLVGEEMLLSPSDTFGLDRQRRTVNFDAVFIYHHASSQQQVLAANGLLQSFYTQSNSNMLARTYPTIVPLRNRFTFQKILVIPSLAAGFAKLGQRSLMITRADYADFMKTVIALHTTDYLLPQWGALIGSPQLPAPIYTAGSWNEEFEGHAVFPAAYNQSLLEVRQRGFDLAFAIKQVFGWNHYTKRPILRPTFQAAL